MENAGREVEDRDRAATAAAGQHRGGRVRQEAARRALRRASRIERDAVIVVSKTRPAAGTVRLGYLVGAASWSPQYRLRGGADNAPVRLEYLAAVIQQTGEDWPDVRVTLSTARPSLDAAPPELLPLNMAVADPMNSGPIEAKDDRSQKIAAELGKLIDMPFPNETPLEDVIKYIRAQHQEPGLSRRHPDLRRPARAQEADKTMTSPVVFDVKEVPLRTSLKLMLKQLGLGYQVKDGSADDHLAGIRWIRTAEDHIERLAGTGRHGWHGRHGRHGRRMRCADVRSSRRRRWRSAEPGGRQRIRPRSCGWRTASGPAGRSLAEKDSPSVTFPIAGRLDIPSRPDPQLLEVARIELAGRLLRQGHARADAAGLSPGQADQQERAGAPARRGDGLRRRRFRGPDAAAAGGRRRAVPRRVRRRPAVPGQPPPGPEVCARCRGAIRSSTTSSGIGLRNYRRQSGQGPALGPLAQDHRARRWPSTS